MGFRRKRALTVTKPENHVVKKSKQEVSSLLDIAAKRVASTFVYQQIEEKLEYVPVPVLKSILYHSFPTSERSIALYSSNTIHVNSHDAQKQPFQIGLKLLELNAVTNVMQIGFHLSGQVNEKVGICNKQKICTYKCSISFDRNCITSTECSCNNKSLLWCAHIVAVTVYRIRNPDIVPIKPPISDSIINLNADKLQKLLLLLISSHKNEILPAVQELVNNLNKSDSEINKLNGLPDPTAGSCYSDENTWHLDNDDIRQQIRTGLLQGNISKNIISLMNKVREMISVNDRNYMHLLLSVTDAIMNESIENLQLQACQRTKRIYDELQSLWYCVFLNPNLDSTTRNQLESYLAQWFAKKACPKENNDDPKSMYLLQSVTSSIAQEKLSSTSATIEVHNLIGQKNQSLIVAKQLLTKYKTEIIDYKENELFTNSIESVNIIFNTFVSHDHQNEAMEWALICLSQSLELPHGEYYQNRLSHRYEQFISELENINVKSSVMQNTILTYSRNLYNKMLKIKEDNVSILPNHSFIRFLFEKLIKIDYELAFNLSLLMLPLKDYGTEEEEDENNATNDLQFNGCKCHVTGQLEYHQEELAASILKECFKNSAYLKLSLSTILENIRQTEHLFRLAKLCRQLINDITQTEHNVLFLNTAFELAIQSLQIVNNLTERKTIIRWVVTCSIDLGKQAIDFLIRNWNDLFTPKEIANDVAPMLTSQPVFCRLSLTTVYEKEQYLNCIRDMVIEACIRDPVPCILFALTLSEDQLESFELVCQICYESGERFNAAQLFSVARYLESKNHQQRAFKIGVQALKKLDLGALDSQHPAICDVLWFSTLTSNLGIDELTQVVPVIENCIRNPLVLTEIAERCANPAYNKSVNKLSCNKEPLSRLIALAQKLFIEDIELKLQNITRKNYSDFADYLSKIKRAFLLADDGLEQFKWLIDFVLTSQKGKKKLHQLISKIVSSN